MTLEMLKQVQHDETRDSKESFEDFNLKRLKGFLMIKIKTKDDTHDYIKFTK